MLQDFLNSFNTKKGRLTINEEACNYCGICEKKCPHLAIKVQEKKQTWKLRLICMKCGRCVRECPSKALQLVDFSN